MEQITKYFNAEKNESILFIGVGVLAIILGIYFLKFTDKSFYTGFAYPAMAIALIQIVVGSTVYFRSPKDIIRVENIVSNEKAKIETEEIPRMKAVMKNFVLYRYIEIGLILIGIFMFFYFKDDFKNGIGLGLAIQAGIMLFLDFFAEKRGHEYIDFLNNLSKN